MTETAPLQSSLADVTMLGNRDYTVVVARTTLPMAEAPPGYEERWQAAHQAILGLAHACEQFDPDGITLYLASASGTCGTFNKYERVLSEQVSQILQAEVPPPSCDLLEGLQSALEDHFNRKAAGQMKANGGLILVIVDGEPSDRLALAKAIVQATKKLDSDRELRLGFVQIGDDLLTRGFLQALDENLKTLGAKFDIVNTETIQEVESTSLVTFLTHVISD